jgi:putative ABC transport system substrate-binding protein
MKMEKVNGFLVLRSGFFLRLRKQVSALAGKARLPSIFGHGREAAAGGLMSYGANTKTLWRAAATYVDKILKGADPAELPISQATKFNLVVNLKTAKALGITFPRSILLRADRVIE